MVNEVLLWLASLVNDLTELLVAGVRLGHLVSIKDVTPDVPGLCRVIFDKVFHDKIIERSQVLPHNWVVLPQALSATKAWH